MCIYIFVYTYKYVCMYTHMYEDTYIYIYICICTYTYVHKHISNARIMSIHISKECARETQIVCGKRRDESLNICTHSGECHL